MMTKSTGARDNPPREKISLDQLKATLSLEDEVRRAGVRLMRTTGGMKGLCPFHDERTPSFYVFTDHAHCFSCGFHGNVLDFMARNENLELSEVIGREVRIYQGLDPAARPTIVRTKQERSAQREQPGTPRIPAPEGFNSLFRPNQKPDDQGRVWTNEILNPNNPDKQVSRLPVDMCHEYRLADGSLYGYVVRTPRFGKEAKKITPAVMWLDGVKMPDGKIRDGWCYTSFPYPRPIYGLYALGEHVKEGGQKRVIVVEGEKCVDKSINVLRDMGWAVVSWCGGTSVPHRTDWSPLAGWDVVLWPDADESGAGAMAELVHLIQQAGAANVMVVPPPAAAPKKWDIADAVEPKADAPEGWRTPWDAERLAQHLETAIPAQTYLEMNGLAQPPDVEEEKIVEAEEKAMETMGNGQTEPRSNDAVEGPYELSVANVLELTSQDEGTPFLAQVLEWTADLEERNEPEFARLEAGLRRRGVSMRQWKRALQRVKQEKAQRGHGIVLPVDEDGINEGRQALIDQMDVTFSPLGHNNGIYYYLTTLTNEVVALRSNQHKDTDLYRIAPLEFWAAAFPKGNDRLSVNWSAAANHLMQRCHEIGNYMADGNGRGRGVHKEKGKLVVHFGRFLAINDKGTWTTCLPAEARKHGLEKQYLVSPAIWGTAGMRPEEWLALDPIDDAEWNESWRILDEFPFGHNDKEGKLDRALYKGYAITAPLCGVTKHRAAIAVEGPSGAGKSTVQKFKMALMGGSVIHAGAGTTSPGILQAIQFDALPLCMDEAESKEETAHARIKRILSEVFRPASDGGAGRLIANRNSNGAEPGAAAPSNPRTAGSLYAIRMDALIDVADVNRVTKLYLRAKDASKMTKDEAWEYSAKGMELIGDRLEHLNSPLRLARWMKRVIETFPLIDHNYAMLRNAIYAEFRIFRCADQFATLLGGHEAIHSRKLDKESAFALIKEYNLERFISEVRSPKALAQQILSTILSHQMRIEGGNNVGTVTRDVYEVILAAAGQGGENDPITDEIAGDHLRRIGIIVTGETMFLATNHPNLKPILDRAKLGGEMKEMSRLMVDAFGDKGISKHGTLRFGGHASKAIAFPLEFLLKNMTTVERDEDDDEQANDNELTPNPKAA
ncbi:hypothetical protein GAY28_01520 [Azospirillum brasilense]|nr:hypothetical protein [Azospirillum brasilense]